MGNFNRGGGDRPRFGGGGSRMGGGSRFGGGNRGDDRDRTMHKTTCSDCGKSCEVPFRPSGDKPVFCNDCFAKKGGGNDRPPRREFNDRGPRRDFGDRAPAPMARPAPASDERIGDIKRKLEALDVKLDKLIQSLATPKTEKKVEVKAPAKPVKKIVKKPVAKKGKK